jgi:DNA-directed RNA polymerase alpha subunit
MQAKPSRRRSAQQKSDLPKLAAPARRALASAGVRALGQLTKFSENEIKQLHGIGPNALKELKRAMKASGLAFKKEN